MHEKEIEKLQAEKEKVERQLAQEQHKIQRRVGGLPHRPGPPAGRLGDHENLSGAGRRQAGERRCLHLQGQVPDGQIHRIQQEAAHSQCGSAGETTKAAGRRGYLYEYHPGPGCGPGAGGQAARLCPRGGLRHHFAGAD